MRGDPKRKAKLIALPPPQIPATFIGSKEIGATVSRAMTLISKPEREGPPPKRKAVSPIHSDGMLQTGNRQVMRFARCNISGRVQM